MKNLENYGVQTLNAKEIREIEGGDPFDNWQPSQDTVWLGTVSSTSLAEQSGFNFGYFCGKLLKNGVEGMLPF
ncbi:hypothetical protein [Lutibacter sp.]